MKRVISYVVLVVGLTLISLPLYAQGLFPGLEVRDMKNWLITFAIGAVFTVFWYVIKRWIQLVDDLNKSVQTLTTETKMHRQEALGYKSDIKILKRRGNIVSNWIHQHDNLHAKCPNCPDNNVTFNEVINDTDL